MIKKLSKRKAIMLIFIAVLGLGGFYWIKYGSVKYRSAKVKEYCRKEAIEKAIKKAGGEYTELYPPRNIDKESIERDLIIAETYEADDYNLFYKECLKEWGFE